MTMKRRHVYTTTTLSPFELLPGVQYGSRPKGMLARQIPRRIRQKMSTNDLGPTQSAVEKVKTKKRKLNTNVKASESSKRVTKKRPYELPPVLINTFPEQRNLDASIRNQGNHSQKIEDENKSDWNSEVGKLEKLDSKYDTQKLSPTISSDDILKLWEKMKKKRSQLKKSQDITESLASTSSKPKVKRTIKKIKKKRGDKLKQKKEEPEIGMAVEICDTESIWSSGKIVRIVEEDSVLYVEVSYDGWDDKWNDTMPWDNNPRLAKIRTHTKRSKCMVDLIPKPKHQSKDKKNCHYWPCIVNFRVPNSSKGIDKYSMAETALRAEPKIFIEPYGLDDELLPKQVMYTVQNGGIWLDSKRLRTWRGNFEGIGRVSENFDLAQEIAINDETIPTIKVSHSIFESGTLLKREYRAAFS